MFARQAWVVVHRWAGLTIALFVVVAGATGALLPWNAALTFASRPSLSRAVPPVPGAQPLDGVVVADRVATATGAEVSFVPLRLDPDHVVRLSVAARAGEPALAYDTVWADPYTGAVRLRFRYAVLADGPQNIMPFMLQLHYGLVLGAWGVWAFGVAALVWALDCFVGFALTLPVRRRVAERPGAASWWTRWRPAWLVRRHARGHRLHFDLHRAGGLWLWPLLFVFAWSAVGLNLPGVRAPVMAALGGSGETAATPLAAPSAPPLSIGDARRVGARLMAAEARARGFAVVAEGYVYHDAATGRYGYAVRTDRDPTDREASTRIEYDARAGRLTRFVGPLGATATDGVMRWFDLLHFAQVFGLPYRIFVSALGVAVVGLTVTGVLVWMKKRSARLLVATRRRSAVPSAAAVPAE